MTCCSRPSTPRQSLRAERDAIAARYDARREAAARVQAKFYEPSEEPDDTLDPMREPRGLFRALADPDGAAGSGGRQAEREQAIAVAVRDAVVLTDAEGGRDRRERAGADDLTELDRVALRHAYLLLRQNNPGASRVLDTGGAASWRLWVEVLRAT